MSRTQINSSLIGTAVGQNILDNGGMEIWQRGTSFSNPAINTYTADRWKISVTGAPSWVVSRDSTAANVDTGTYSMSVNITSVGGSTVFNHFQLIENFADYRGQTVSFSARVKASVAGAIQVRVEADATTTFSSFHSGSGNFETLTATITVPSNASQLDVQMGFVGNSTPVATQFWLDSAMLVVGSPTTFVPTNPQVDLARCQRFFQIYGNSTASGNTLAHCFGVSSTVFGGGSLRLPVLMRVAPTSTVTSASLMLLNDGSGNVAVTGVTLDGLTTSGARFSGTTAGSLTAFHMYAFSPQDGTFSFSADL